MAAGFGHEPRKHDRAWRWLAYADPDVALLQEANPPSWARDHWPHLEHSRTYQDQGWGTAILSKTASLEPAALTSPWLSKLAGKVHVAKLGGAKPLWLASIHSNANPLRPEDLTGMPIDRVRRCHDESIWQIEVLVGELMELFSGDSFVVGGDLNSGMLFDTNYGYDYNARLWANLAAEGLHDLRPRFEQLEQRTFFRTGSRPYQLDHLFADEHTVDNAISWRVRTEPAEIGLVSDHAPVEVVLGL